MLTIVKHFYPITYLLFCFFQLQVEAQNSPDLICINLHDEWEFRPAKQGVWSPAEVPGSVHSDLLKNELIRDPFSHMNEKEVQWIEEEDWLYQSVFNCADEIAAKQNIVLHFKGLDTYADVYLNEQLILQADNMFRSWNIDVKKILKSGENHLKIHFHSPMKMARPRRDALNYSLPAGNDAQEEKLSVFTRKAPFQFGWDWGPRLVTAGIWRPIELTAWDKAGIKDCLLLTSELNEDRARIKAKIELKKTGVEKVQLRIRDTENGNVLLNKQFSSIENNQLEANFIIDKPKLWWCNGLGSPHLYKLNVELLTAKGEQIDAKLCKLGIRNIELVQEADSIGTSFYFKLNGIPVFMKGANYIPSDNLLDRVNKERYQMLVEAARDANMNMLRVWGGGIYEEDLFYDLCDENGILVWQDFMFACSMYPGDKAFLENVRAEVQDNIIRLRQHPCIALWCGNNEMDVAWHNWGWQSTHRYSKADSTEIWNNYQTLFHQIIPYELLRLDPLRPYVSTSPLSNWGTMENFNHGSMHYWGVWHGNDHFEGYEKYVGRFMSEYGFQSFPSHNTIKKFSSTSDRRLDSPVMKHRQKSYKGNGLIYEFMDELLPRPEKFTDFLYFSQLTQAEGLKKAFNSHRAKKPHCMGTLYWQLNDCWPAISWSGIDYYGNWKALHHYAKRAFQPLVVLPYESDGKFKVKINSDLNYAVEPELLIQLFDFKGRELFHTVRPIRVDSLSNEEFYEIEVKSWLSEHSPQSTFATVSLYQNERVLASSDYHFLPYKDQDLGPGNFKTEISNQGGYFLLSLSCKELVRGLQLESAQDGHFDDNFFDLKPGRARIVKFTPKEPVDIVTFKNGLSTRSVNQVMRELDRE